MEILYLWIEKYRNIKNQGFNFSPRYCFNFDFNGKKFSYKDKGEEYIKDYFEGNVRNVTAVVGRNGVGKSNLLEYILRMRMKDCNYLYVIDYHEKKDILIETNFEFTNQTIFKVKQNSLEDIPIITYSNILDYSQSEFDDPDAYHQGLYLEKYENLRLNYLMKFQPFYRKNLLDQIYFVLNKSKFKVTFNIPQYLRISNRNIINTHIGGMDISYKFLIDKIRVFKGSKEDEFFIKLKGDIIHCLIMLDVANNGDLISDELNALLKKHFKNKKKLLDENIFDSIDSFLIAYNEPVSQKVNLLIGKLSLLISKRIIEIGEYLSFIVKDETFSYLVEIIDLLNNTIDVSTRHFIIFNWSGMSTGEYMMLSIYSRFYSVRDKVNTIKEKSLLILIDEGEIGFHPEWQRTFLNYLIDFLPQIYLDKQIQIILATHSPFLISDLPNENIIFLDEGENGTENEGNCIVVNGLKDIKQTFASNIHTLLSDNFFLDKGLIGEFAKNKILTIMQDLDQENKKKPSDERLDQIKK